MGYKKIRQNSVYGIVFVLSIILGIITEDIVIERKLFEKSIDIASCTVSEIDAQAWTGKSITPLITVKDGNDILENAQDYVLSYYDNTEPGKARIHILGIGNYSGNLDVMYEIKKVKLEYRAYVQKKGWMEFIKAAVGDISDKSGMAGTFEKLRIEAIQMKLSGVDGAIKYRSYVQGRGWMEWVDTEDTTQYTGLKGEAKRIEMIQLKTTGEVDKLFDLYYRVYSDSYGWLGWAANGEKAGTAGYSLGVEAFQVVFVKKGEEFDKGKDKSYYDKSIDG